MWQFVQSSRVSRSPFLCYFNFNFLMSTAATAAVGIFIFDATGPGTLAPSTRRISRSHGSRARRTHLHGSSSRTRAMRPRSLAIAIYFPHMSCLQYSLVASAMYLIISINFHMSDLFPLYKSRAMCTIINVVRDHYSTTGILIASVPRPRRTGSRTSPLPS
jgi:hypothetical protein